MIASVVDAHLNASIQANVRQQEGLSTEIAVSYVNSQKYIQRVLVFVQVGIGDGKANASLIAMLIEFGAKTVVNANLSLLT